MCAGSVMTGKSIPKGLTSWRFHASAVDSSPLKQKNQQQHSHIVTADVFLNQTYIQDFADALLYFTGPFGRAESMVFFKTHLISSMVAMFHG